MSLWARWLVFLVITRISDQKIWTPPFMSNLIAIQKCDECLGPVGDPKRMQLQRRKLWSFATRLLLWLSYLLGLVINFSDIYFSGAFSRNCQFLLSPIQNCERAFGFGKLHLYLLFFPRLWFYFRAWAKWVQIYLLPLSNCHLANLVSHVRKIASFSSAFRFSLPVYFSQFFYRRNFYSAMSWIARKGEKTKGSARN